MFIDDRFVFKTRVTASQFALNIQPFVSMPSQDFYQLLTY